MRERAVSVHCYLDCETTGLDPYHDRIVEITLLRVVPGAEREALTTLVDPGMPIPPSATATHGITDADVASAPSFAEIAGDVEGLVSGAVLVGYNSHRFDVPLIDAELRRASRAGLARDQHGAVSAPEIDLLLLWRAFEPRDLATAARRFAGVEHDGAHRSKADAEILFGVLVGMLDGGLPGLDGDEAKLIEATRPADEIDRDGKFKRRDDGVAVFAFGKHDGRPVAEEMGYVDWMMSKDFSPETKAWCRRFREEQDARRGSRGSGG
jgi:DNA polymerase-3 subunit epsilon